MKAAPKETAPASLYFPSVLLAQANRRVGKHYKIIADILSDLARVDEYSAIKTNLAEAGKKKADLRAALHRAAKQKNIRLATASDERNLYVFSAALPKL